jgi:hypothetical protein
MNSFTEILNIHMGNISRMPVIGLKHEQFHGNYINAYGKHFMKNGWTIFPPVWGRLLRKTSNSDNAVVKGTVSQDFRPLVFLSNNPNWIDTAGAASVVSLIPLVPPQQCQ